jgi:hypothetical protein
MTVADELAGLVADTVAAFGQVDVLVNNVGGNVAVTPFASSTPEQWAGCTPSPGCSRSNSAKPGSGSTPSPCTGPGPTTRTAT